MHASNEPWTLRGRLAWHRGLSVLGRHQAVRFDTGFAVPRADPLISCRPPPYYVRGILLICVLPPGSKPFCAYMKMKYERNIRNLTRVPGICTGNFSPEFHNY
jgi:hypothetical protein